MQEELEKLRLAADEEKRKLVEEFEAKLETEREDMKTALAEAEAEKNRQAGESEEKLTQLRTQMEQALNWKW